MRTFICFLAVLLFVSLGNAQVIQDHKFLVPLVNSEVDTIPGTQTGGIGNGGAGWLFVGMDDVYYTLTCVDSVQAVITFDYADSGYASASGSSAKSVGFKAATRTVGEDSLIAVADEANPKAMVSNCLRSKQGGIDKIKGAQYIRAIITANSSKNAGLAADRTVRLHIIRIKR
jgi:hypothetical protein